MDNVTEFIHCDEYLLATVTAPWNTQTAINFINAINDEASKGRYHRILLDLTFWDKPDSEFTRFESGKYLAKLLRPPFKIAAYAIPDAINKFGENAAVNRGALFRIFADEQSAIQWLMEDNP